MSEENYSSGDPGDPSKGAVIFRQRCATCHTYTQVSKYVLLYACMYVCMCMQVRKYVCVVLLQGEQSASGPNLFGVFGRRVADDNNYQKYSLAVLYKDIVWNEKNLFKFLRAPRKFIPGTKMFFPGIQSGGDRKGRQQREYSSNRESIAIQSTVPALLDYGFIMSVTMD